jgi:hypothetical protein
MARFAFVSYPAWGHIDFGGRSFLRTARMLVDRGHDVTWVLPIGPDVVVQATRFGVPQLQIRRIVVGIDVQAAIKAAGIAVERIDACFDLMDASQGRDRAIASARTFAAFLTEHRIDACLVDRLAVVAGLGCEAARVPWCVVGGDGARWTTSSELGSIPGTHDAFPFDEVCDALGANDLPEACRRSFWAMSPYLNLTFLFRGFSATVPAVPTHFVGGRVRSDEARETVLVTLGTTFGREALDAFLRGVVELSSLAPDRAVEILTSTPAITRQLVEDVASAPRVVVRDWAPYDEAFGRASVAIGHGGNGFVWHAVAAAVPMIAVPTRAGDQRYGADRIVELGLGVRIEPDAVTGAALEAAIREVAAGTRVHARVRDASAALASGGGVDAAVRLVEQLAATARAVVSCVDAPCCCAVSSAVART